MSRKTKEERYLIKHYQMAIEKGDEFAEIDSMEVAKQVNERERTVNNLLKHLQQANFIRRSYDTFFVLTSNGLNLIKKI